MKTKTTRNILKANYSNIYKCGYTELYYIFNGVEPNFYNSGVYGWNYDAYTINNIAITTGYRSTIGKSIPRELIKKYSDKAKKILDKYRWVDYDTQQKELKENRINFINELIQL